jgi:fimbrial chaperone protein
MPPMTRRCLLTLLTLFLLLSPAPARSGEWRVSPVRLELGRNAKSGVVTVFNESDEPLQVQIRAFEWTQDAEGRDRYTKTEDLLFFPRMMIFAEKEERILRAGIRVPAAKKEKAYRLYLEEIPGPRKDEGVNVAIAIRIGVPVFVKPLKEEPKGEIGMMGMAKGVLTIPVRNAGNVHFIIRSTTVTGENAKGEKVFSRDIGGWYLLADASRLYATEIPEDVCRDLVKIEVEAKTDRFSFSGGFVPVRTMCEP